MNGPERPDRPQRRLFFALWPGDAHRAALAAANVSAVAGVRGRPVSPGGLHLTLAFLGMVPGQALASLVEAGGRAPWPAVEIAFDRLEYWARPRVLVALPSSVPASSREIVDRLWRSLEPQGFTRESRPWQPHMTVVRRIREPPPENLVLVPVDSATDPSPWRLALVESVSHPGGARYQPLADWPLG